MFRILTAVAALSCPTPYWALRQMGSRCVFLPGALVSCSDGVRNGNEEGVDCGGSQCAPCDEHTGRVSTMLGAASTPVVAIAMVSFVLAASVLVAGVVIPRRSSRCKSCRRRCCPGTLEGTSRWRSGSSSHTTVTHSHWYTASFRNEMPTALLASKAFKLRAVMARQALDCYLCVPSGCGGDDRLQTTTRA